LAGALVAVLAAVPLTVITALVLSHSEGLRDWDASVVDAVHDEVLARPDLARLLGWLSVVTHPNSLRLASVVVVIALWRRRHRRRALWFAVTMALGGALSPLLKNLVERARPVFEEPVE